MKFDWIEPELNKLQQLNQPIDEAAMELLIILRMASRQTSNQSNQLTAQINSTNEIN